MATIAVVFMMFMSIVFFFPMDTTTDAQSMNYTVVVLGGTLSLSIIWYYFPKYGGVNWFAGPVPNIDSVSDHSSKHSSEEEDTAALTR